MKDVTIVPSDHTVIVDGEALRLSVSVDSDIHAIQWRGNTGHIEYTDKPNKTIGMVDYNQIIAPIVMAFDNEKKAQADTLERLRIENLPTSIRNMRDMKLAMCDYIFAEDYPVSESTKAQWVEYRKQLRDITDMPGFPWKSINDVPWPTAPTSIH